MTCIHDDSILYCDIVFSSSVGLARSGFLAERRRADRRRARHQLHHIARGQSDREPGQTQWQWQLHVRRSEHRWTSSQRVRPTQRLRSEYTTLRPCISNNAHWRRLRAAGAGNSRPLKHGTFTKYQGRKRGNPKPTKTQRRSRSLFRTFCPTWKKIAEFEDTIIFKSEQKWGRYRQKTDFGGISGKNELFLAAIVLADAWLQSRIDSLVVNTVL